MTHKPLPHENFPDKYSWYPFLLLGLFLLQTFYPPHAHAGSPRLGQKIELEIAGNRADISVIVKNLSNTEAHLIGAEIFFIDHWKRPRSIDRLAGHKEHRFHFVFDIPSDLQGRFIAVSRVTYHTPGGKMASSMAGTTFDVGNGKRADLYALAPRKKFKSQTSLPISIINFSPEPRTCQLSVFYPPGFTHEKNSVKNVKKTVHLNPHGKTVVPVSLENPFGMEGMDCHILFSIGYTIGNTRHCSLFHIYVTPEKEEIAPKKYGSMWLAGGGAALLFSLLIFGRK